MNFLQRMGAALLGLDVKRSGRGSQPAIHAAASSDGKPVSSEWSAEKAVSEGLKASSWVYSAVSKIATGLASVPLVLEKRTGDTWTPEPGHELQRLLNQPNPFMARQDLHERWAHHMLLAGNALWWLNIVGGKPTELWPIPPDQIKPLASRAEFISGYEWKISSSDKRTLPVSEVGHWMFVDPGNPRWGLAPLQAAAAAVDLDQAAARWNRAVLANDGKPPLAVFLDSALSIDQMRQASALIREQINGASVRQALVLGGASKAQPLSLSASELDFLNGRRFSREEIGAVIGVPPILMSFGEAATFSNLDAAKAILWEDRIVPLLDDLAQGLMANLFGFWGLTQDQYRIRPDLSGVRALQANMKTEAEVAKLRAETFKVLTDGGVPPNMAAAAAGVPLEKIPGGDQPRAAAPAAAPAQTKSRPPPPRLQRKDKGEDREVAARLARMDEWTEEIRKKVAAVLLEQGSTLASAYAAGQPWEDALDLDSWQALLEAVHTAVIEAEGAVAYSAVLGAITAAGGGGAFDVLADGVQEWIASHVGDNIRYIDETTRLALRTEISAGVEAGESSREIAKRLRAVHEDWAGWRAERIARTEVAAAFGAAHQESAMQVADLGVEMEKRWNSTADDRTRDAHAAMDGETVAIDEPFSNGAMTTGTEPNCRCVATYSARTGGE